MAKKSDQANLPEQGDAAAQAVAPPAKSRLGGWAIAGLAAGGALLLAGSAAAGAIVGVSALGPEPQRALSQEHRMDDDDREDHQGGREGCEHDDDGEHGDRERNGTHQGDRDDRDAFQRQQGPGMADQRPAPQQPAPDTQSDVTP